MTSETANPLAPKWQVVATCNLGGCPTVYAGTQGDVLVQGYVQDGSSDVVRIPSYVLQTAAQRIFSRGQ